MSFQLSKTLESSIISTASSQISSELAEEAVILNLDSGIYYGLNEVGARVWELIQQPRSFGELHETLLAEYDVSAEVCKQDLTRIITDLESARLVEVSDEAQ